MKFGVRKLESWGYQTVMKCFLRFDTIPACDGHIALAKTSASIASCG